MSKIEKRLLFDEDVKNYDRIRPKYPNDLLKEILNYAEISSESNVLEIGIGTGKATKLILESGCNYTAVEIGSKLARFSKEKYKDYNNIRVINDDFVDCPLEKNYFDLVFCATSFHWLPEEKAYLKIKKLLRKEGTLALFWNHPYPNRQNDPSNLINKRVYEKYRSNEKKSVEFTEKDCCKYVDKLKYYGFQQIKVKIYHRTRTLSSDDYLLLLNTYSDHRCLSLERKTAFEQDMKVSLDEIGGIINIYDTLDLYLARKV